jgi:tetratricopeptide (TPR) repeat protein
MTALPRLLPLLAALFLSAECKAAPPARFTPAQSKRWTQRNQLLQRANVLLRDGQSDEAAAAVQKALKLERAIFGGVSGNGVVWLSWLARWHQDREQFARAVASRRELLALRKQWYGEDDWRIVDARLDLEDVRVVAALPAAQRQRLAQADDWGRQALALWQQHKPAEALPLLEKVLAVRREVLGEKHRDTAASWFNLGAQHLALNHFPEALSCNRKALAINKEVLGEKHPRYAHSLNNLAYLHQGKGEFATAVSFLQQARDLYLKLFGDDHPSAATSLSGLAWLYREMGDWQKALPLYLRACERTRAVLGEKHLEHVRCLNGLGSLYREMGEHTKALPVLIEARELTRKGLGETHPEYPVCLGQLGLLYLEMGELAKALSLDLQTCELVSRIRGKKHPDYAASLHNLALLYRVAREYAKALPLALEARDRYRDLFGKKHPLYARGLNNLAMIYVELGEHQKALPLLLEAVDLDRKTLGEKHPECINSLNNLAILYHHMGEHEKALPLYLEAVALRRKAQGTKHPFYAGSLSYLAYLYQDMGKPRKGVAASRQAVAVLDEYLQDSFDHLGEHQRIGLMYYGLYQLGLLLTLLEEAGHGAPERYAPVLAWKGRGAAHGKLDVLLRDRLVRDDPESGKLLKELQSVRGHLAVLGLQTPPPSRQAAWLKQLTALTDQKQRLEADLSRRFAPFRQLLEQPSLTAEQLSKEIPAGVAFVDLLEYGHSIAQKGKSPGRSERRLLAFVLRRGTGPVVVSLGALAPIAEAVSQWRVQVQKLPSLANRDLLDRAGQTLRRLVWQPLSKHLGGAKTIVVAPDGVLCQFPLAALPGSKQDSYLIEEVAIAQVSSARQLFDLLKPMDKPGTVPAATASPLLALGGVDYGSGTSYPALAGTLAEARSCRELFRRAFPDEVAHLLSGKEATVVAVQKALQEKKPRWLHLATHGFFDPPDRV